MSNIHLSIYPITANDVIKGVLDFIRANGYPELYLQWFDTDARQNECIVSSYKPDKIDTLLEEAGCAPFNQIDGIDDVSVDEYNCYRFNNGKYYIITF